MLTFLPYPSKVGQARTQQQANVNIVFLRFRLGKDKTWNYVDQRYTLIEEVVFVEDKLFAVDDWSRLYISMLLLRPVLT